MEGSRLQELRLRYRLTQRQVADAAGMRQPDLSAIENGRRGTEETRNRVLAAIRTLARPGDALDPKTRDDIRAVLERFGATNVRIFGSVARGSDRPGSDLDLIAKFPPHFDLFDLMKVEDEIEEALGLPVDVVSDNLRTQHALTQAKREAVTL